MTRSAEPPVGRTARRKRRRRTVRQIERTRRSARTLLVVSAAAIALLLSCAFGVDGWWCVPQPFQFIGTIVLSVLAGLSLGGTIRAERERRALGRDAR